MGVRARVLLFGRLDVDACNECTAQKDYSTVLVDGNGCRHKGGA